ncbi:MAG: TrmH family RNA methyltransferase [Bacteroidota bacterium]
MRKLKNVELDRKSIDEFKSASKTPLIIILDNIRSLNNIGSVFRTADAFLVQKIYLCGISAQPPHKDIQKTALGATESVEWEYVQDTKSLVQKLQQQGVLVHAIEQAEKSTMLNNFIPGTTKTHAFIFGNEVKGVQQAVVDIADSVIEIPQLGTKHSLNISVSTGVCIWDFMQKTKRFTN